MGWRMPFVIPGTLLYRGLLNEGFTVTVFWSRPFVLSFTYLLDFFESLVDAYIVNINDHAF